MLLVTIQKRNNLNVVYTCDEPGPGGAHHHYAIFSADVEKQHGLDLEDAYAEIQFQQGPRKEADSVHGVLDTDLLEIVRDRLKDFQAGPFACRENAIALTHIEDALLWMNKRVEDRAERGVLGTTNK